jgi:hypothetical protein
MGAFFPIVMLGSFFAALAFGKGSTIGKILLALFLMTCLPAIRSWGLRLLCFILMPILAVLIIKLFGWR